LRGKQKSLCQQKGFDKITHSSSKKKKDTESTIQGIMLNHESAKKKSIISESLPYHACGN
jgi:hypothetical protein